MKKIFKLKKWLTLDETSRRLTTVFEEEITVADCLQLALDGYIKISALVEGGKYVVDAKIVKTTQREALEKFIISTSEEGAIVRLLDEERFVPNYQLDHEYEAIERNGNVCSLEGGVYDLPMIGSEKLDVMHAFDLAQDREPREFVNIEGAFLNAGGRVLNVLKNYNEFSYKPDDSGRVRIFDSTQNKFVDFSNWHSFFYPDDGLRDVEFVFRRENIEQFEKGNLGDEGQSLTMDESLLVIGSMLNALKNAQTPSKRWTQDAIKAEILEKSKAIKSRTLDDYFSTANKAFKTVS
ncbi:hypothetical protein [Obesumbacterium proteus]|uniref:hypothetical protein n=1 Tax=Obesumbacterium proteus TaxID=82983 RepID=UPI001F22ABF0|nr:hypothetical protein [Obesumbacterium proteus]MCE9886529.1 hypothetical protein [Obesumbacterium proteus]MCE9918089.1 hypothetical protein [Obesumbacterium proteus]MCE9931198.1 hypothetical protein [Obesumbacterium proteus]